MPPDTAIGTPRVSSKRGLQVFEFIDYSNGAITTGNNKYEWIVPFYGRITDVICDSETGGTGNGFDRIDVNKNGTTIFTTQARRPRLETNDTGKFVVGEIEVNTLVPGDILGYDIDDVCAGAGSARFKISIIIEPR